MPDINKGQYSYNDIINDINQGKIDNIYVFFGEEEYFAQAFASKLKENIINENSLSLDYYYKNFIQEKKVSLSQIEELLIAPPFLSEKKLIVLKNTELFNCNAKQAEAIINFICKLEKTNVIVFIEKIFNKKLKKLQEIIQLKGKLIESKKNTKKDLENFITDYQKNNKIKFNTVLINELIERSDFNLLILESELNKLYLYSLAKDDKTLKSEENNQLFKLLKPNYNGTVFSWIEAMCKADIIEAYKLLYRLKLNNKDSETTFIFYLTRQLKQLMLAKAAHNLEDLHVNLNLDYFICRKLYDYSQKFTYKQLYLFYQQCFYLEQKLITGKLNKDFVLDLISAYWYDMLIK